MNIDTFKSQVSTDFARSNLFRCSIAFPSGTDKTDDDTKVQFFIRAAQIPASTIGVIEVPFMGRTYKIPGDRTFEPWTITVMADAKMGLRRSFESWINLTNNAKKNRSSVDGLGYLKPMEVHLFGKQGKAGNKLGEQVIKKYKFHHSYPTNISSIDVDANANDTITEFTVEMQYAYWTVIEGDNQNGGTLPEV